MCVCIYIYIHISVCVYMVHGARSIWKLKNIYIYILSGHKWSTTHWVLKSHRRKMSIIYMLSWKQCALPVITTIPLCRLIHWGKCKQYIMCPSTWVATKPLWWLPGGHIVFMITYIYIYYIYSKTKWKSKESQIMY